MKYNIIFIFALILISLQSFAQTEVGVYVLPLKTSITGEDGDYIELNPTFGGGAGASVKFGISNSLLFETGLLYTSQNQKFVVTYESGAGNFIEHKGKKRLDYLKLPLLLKYRQLVSDKIAVNLFAGPQVSYLLKGDGAIVAYKKGVHGYDYFDLPVSNSNYYKKLLAEAVVGVGTDYYLNEKVSLNAAFRIDYGIGDMENKNAKLNNEPIYYLNNASRPKNHNLTYGIALGASYRFGNSDHLARPSLKGHQRMHKGRKDIKE